MTTAQPVYVRIVRWDCEECRDALLCDCLAQGIGQPIGEFTLGPAEWVSRECPHRGDGFTLNIALVRSKARGGTGGGDFDNEGDLYEENIDATKGIGYPAREDGSYGSHPSHDGFDDDSEP